MKVPAVLVGLTLVFAACSVEVDESTDQGWEDCATGEIAEVPSLASEPEPWTGPELQLELVAEIDKAVSLFELADGSFLISSQNGELWLVDESSQEVILDLTGVVADGVEQGLIDAVHMTGLLLVSYTAKNDDVVVRSYESSDGLPHGAFKEVIRVEQPHEWHNSGNLEVGPDGKSLFLGLGDGGNIADPKRNGQDLSTLLGSILKLVPFHGGYEIPEDAALGGMFSEDRREVFAYGFRNPWRFSFDSLTGDLWIGDVGQNCVEEIDFVAAGTAGQNFGWSRLEGSHRFLGDIPEDHVLPVFEYLHGDGGCAVTGGYVYRGSAIAELEGIYVFADYCRGRLIGLETDNGQVTGSVSLGPSVKFVTSFGQGIDGELFVLSGTEGVFRLVASG